MKPTKKTVANDPKLLYFWDYQKNTADPTDVNIYSKEKCWWTCPDKECAYSWEAAPMDQKRFSGKCPCHELNRTVLKGVNDIITKSGGKAYNSYDFEANAALGIDPYTLSYKSKNTQIRWECSVCGYSWTASPVARYNSGFSCPVHDTNKVILSGYNDVLTIVKGIRKYYDPELNPGLDITKEGVASEKRVVWHCPDCGRTWETNIITRIEKAEDGTYFFKECPHHNTYKRKKSEVPSISEVPGMLRFWAKDNDLPPEEVKSNSNDKAHWKCPNPECGYDWYSEIRSFSRHALKCPCCESNKVVKPYVNDAFTRCPELMEMFDADANPDIDPHTLKVSDKTPIHWRCPDCAEGCVRTINSMLNHSKGKLLTVKRCRKKYSNDRSMFVSERPDMLKFWDYEANDAAGLRPESTSMSSNATVFWKCPDCAYTWTSKVHPRAARDGRCPVCDSNRVVQPGYNDILTLFPQLAGMFDPAKNPGVDISRLGVTSDERLNLVCPTCGNEWSTIVKSMIDGNKEDGYVFSGCSECNWRGRKAGKIFGEEFANLLCEYSSVNELDPFRVTVNDPRSVEWICSNPECGHPWYASFAARALYNNKCPICNHSYVVADVNSFQAKYPEYLPLYSSANKRPPSEYFFDYKKEPLLWDCPVCGNTFPALISAIVKGSPDKPDCPYCNNTRLLYGFNSLEDIYPAHAKLFSESNGRPASSLRFNSTEYWDWDCPVCGKTFRSSISHLTEFPADAPDCPYCNDRKVLPGFNSLLAKHNTLVTAEWHWVYNTIAGINPDTVSEVSSLTAWWHCENGHVYDMSIFSRIRFAKRRRTACPYCKGLRRKRLHFVPVK